MTRRAAFPLVFLSVWSLSTRLAAAPPAFQDPPFLASEKGVLEVTLTASEEMITVAKKTVLSRVWNATYTPPVFRLQQGDVLRVHQVNELDLPINLHTHGLVTTPKANGDNVFVLVDPNASFD